MKTSRILLAGLVLLLSTLLATNAAGQAAAPKPNEFSPLDTLRREFAKPPKAMRPMVRWWLPGGDVTPRELRREVRVLDEAGFGGAEIQAFRMGLKADMPADVAARVNDYPTPSFYHRLREAVEEAS